MLILAEVKNTSIAFKPYKDENGDEWPLGTITVQLLNTLDRLLTASIVNAAPYTFCRRIPIIGEQVLVFRAPDFFSRGGGENSYIYYYLDPISIQGSVNYNILPNMNIIESSAPNNYTRTTSPVSSKSSAFKPGENFKEQNVKQLQPFEGETIIEGRFGNSIRFGTSYRNYSIYQKNPTYTTNQDGLPILILRNGFNSADVGQTYVVEDIEKDRSSIYLTAGQTINAFKGAQAKVGIGVRLLSQYKEPQIALSSDRIVLNAKRDNVLIVSKTDVVVATPKWQMQMDKLFTLLEQFIDQVNKVMSGQQPLPTGAGPTGPAPNMAQLQKVLSDLKVMKQ